MYSSALINFTLKKKKKTSENIRDKVIFAIIIETEWLNLETYADEEFHA